MSRAYINNRKAKKLLVKIEKLEKLGKSTAKLALNWGERGGVNAIIPGEVPEMPENVPVVQQTD